ncbi:DUF2264 domain-containing protein [Myceligenerans crystallogenes]|uniref:DUF2264 domain-containing protein n=1 Tax=Myceligenerans crystallogenes TaxID=316335 RepID=A0ABN2N1R4_9MICO
MVHPALRPAAAWTRDRWLGLADDLLAATEPFASPGRALISLPGPVSASDAWSDGLEGFARTFLLAAFRLRGQDGDDPHGLLERYADGVRRGTDPGSAERWPRIPERRQAVVEAASIAIGLHETREWLWERLDAGTQERVVGYLADIVGTSGYRNNWIWFQNVIEEFLRGVGGPWDQADLDRNLELQEALYTGDGWYSDGRGHDGRRQNFDWYAGWAWHLYPLLHARIAGEPLAEPHGTRLREFLAQAQHLVGADGAPVLQGRSATYRWAVLAPFWAGAVAGVTPLRPGQTRALTSGVVEHFTAAGAVDADGLLPVGWHHRYDRIRQLYSGGASPYWASKGFLGLLLPVDDAVWTDAPELPDAWREETVTTLRAPGWIVASTPADGVVRLYNHGSDRLLESRHHPHADDPFYQRLAYSNATSPQLTRDAIAAPLESHVALLDAHGTPSHREGVSRVALDGNVAISRSRVRWLDLPGAPGADPGDRGGDHAGVAGHRIGPQVVTASVVRGRFEVRLAWTLPDDDPTDTDTAEGADDAGRPPVPGAIASAAWQHDPGPWTFHLGGWPLAADRDGDLVVERGDDWARVHRRDGRSSLVRALLGLETPGSTRRTGADPIGEISVTPWLRSQSRATPESPVAALVVLTGDPNPRDADADAVDSVHHDPGTGTVEIRWRTGKTDVVPVSRGGSGRRR